MTWKSWAPLALTLVACGGSDNDGTAASAPPPFPDCAAIELADGTLQQLVRTFEGGQVVEEVLDGATVATYTYDGGDLATVDTPTESWVLTWGPDGIASIDATDASGGEIGEYVYFYEGRQLTDIALRKPDGDTDLILVLDWVDDTTSEVGVTQRQFVTTALAPPLTDPLLDPLGLVMLSNQDTSSGELRFDRELDASGAIAIERWYDDGVVQETRTWSYCE